MKLLFGADLGPTKTNFDTFAAGDAKALLGEELLQLFSEADLRCLDLEVPLTDGDTPIQKHGPKLRAPENTVAGIKAMGVNLLTLANNHILDQGRTGLENTLSALDAAGIPHFGTGLYPDCAAPYIFEKDGKRVFYGLDGGWMNVSEWRYIFKNEIVFDAVILDSTFMSQDPVNYRGMGEHNNVLTLPILVDGFRQVGAATEETRIIADHIGGHMDNETVLSFLRGLGMIPAYDGFEIEI